MVSEIRAENETQGFLIGSSGSELLARRFLTHHNAMCFFGPEHLSKSPLDMHVGGFCYCFENASINGREQFGASKGP